ncbi:MAG: CopG family transcriptional regulator [Armatimonadetes bacterium]|nr:CopG family transcriptional regulator [Armatimonadota bacterium]
MVRTQIQLTEKQYQELKRVATLKGVSVAEVIRRSVDNTLASETLPNMNEIKARARGVFGAFSDSQPDVSENHDQYLSEAYEA